MRSKKEMGRRKFLFTAMALGAGAALAACGPPPEDVPPPEDLPSEGLPGEGEEQELPGEGEEELPGE